MRVEVHYDPNQGQDIVFRNAWIPNYVSRSIGSSCVLVNSAGGWLVLDVASLKELESVAIPRSLFDILEEYHLVLTERNCGGYFTHYKRWTEPHFRHPVHHIILTTLRCNLSCTYCHAAVVPAAAGSSFDLDQRTADVILEFASNSTAPAQSFEFQGGESLLNGGTLLHMIPKIQSVYRRMGRSVYMSIQTNATLLTDTWMEFFRANGVKVGTSLDGTAAIHDKQRITASGKGTHAIVAEKVKLYRLPTLPTITSTAAHSWRVIVDGQLASGAQTVAFQNVYPINAAASNWKDVGLNMTAYLDVYLEVVDYLKSLWAEGYYPLERRMHLALKKLMLHRDLDFADFGNPCGMIHSQIAYHTNGDVYTCDEGRDFPEFRLGNVQSDTYDDIVFGAGARLLKSLSIPNDPECKACAYQPYCSTCPVYDRATDGHLVARHFGSDKCRQTLAIYDVVFDWIATDPKLIHKVAEHHGLSRATTVEV